MFVCSFGVLALDVAMRLKLYHTLHLHLIPQLVISVLCCISLGVCSHRDFVFLHVQCVASNTIFNLHPELPTNVLQRRMLESVAYEDTQERFLVQHIIPRRPKRANKFWITQLG